MSDIAESYGRMLVDRIMDWEEGEIYTAENLMLMVEAFRFDEEIERQTANNDNFAALANTFLLDPLRIGNRVPVLPCYLWENILVRLPYWEPYQSLRLYLEQLGCDCMVLFKNESILNSEGALYKAEFRVYPIVDVQV